MEGDSGGWRVEGDSGLVRVVEGDGWLVRVVVSGGWRVTVGW